ncbi:hypothetical protein [Acidisoma sp.]|uniref:hypothetical protein n=1 Tax=Acidisoma sp. TaxID=1872115 RepID=UPI003AFF8DC7
MSSALNPAGTCLRAGRRAGGGPRITHVLDQVREYDRLWVQDERSAGFLRREADAV